MNGGVLDWDILLGSRPDVDGYKQILTDFRANCQEVGIDKYMTMKVSTVSPRDLAVFINFADRIADDNKSGFTTKIGTKEITVTKAYLQEKLNLPQAEEGDALPDRKSVV